MSQARMNFVPVLSTELLSKYFGQTEASIRSVFAQARAAAPCVVFFDEFDALAYKR
jgi:SpoVK/Ycf46/Vps4 family AAA+-type ATPase